MIILSYLQDFFGAVNALREPYGRGFFSVTKTAPQTYDIFGDYCNYECRNCASRLSSSGHMNPTLRLDGGDGDHLFFELKNYHEDVSPASIALMAMQIMQLSVGVSGNFTAQRDDFCGFKFQT